MILLVMVEFGVILYRQKPKALKKLMPAACGIINDLGYIDGLAQDCCYSRA